MPLDPSAFGEARPSAPRKRAMRHRMQFSFGITRKPKRYEQRRLFAEKLGGDELAHADHLEPVVGIGDHINIVAKAIEHRKAIGREAPDATGRFVAIDAVLPFETFLTEGERGCPHVCEI